MTTSTDKTPRKPPLKVIRDPEFAKRFEQACDANPLIPPKHKGRLVWVQENLAKRFDENVSIETVRKWFSGEAKPRPDKLAKLAQFLEVDHSWLSLGVTPDLQPREQKVRNAMADGAVNLVAGLIQMDGGHPAFPANSESGSFVDMHAIIRGAKYDLHVALGEDDGEALRFGVPNKSDSLIILGVVKTGFTVEIFEITQELIQAGTRHGGSIEVVVERGDERLREIDSFKNRL